MISCPLIAAAIDANMITVSENSGKSRVSYICDELMRSSERELTLQPSYNEIICGLLLSFGLFPDTEYPLIVNVR